MVLIILINFLFQVIHRSIDIFKKLQRNLIIFSPLVYLLISQNANQQ